MAEAYIQIPGLTCRGDAIAKAPTIQPNNSSFEQLSWLVYESIIVDLLKQTGTTQQDIDARHANME